MKKSNLSIEVVTITPKLAREWLKKNIMNRGIQQKVVNQYVQDMMIGDWLLTGDSIKFSNSDELLDGQHRLLAIVQSNTSQKILVIKGLDKDIFYVLDKGKRRSFHDVLTINQYKNASLTAATTRLCYIYNVTKFKGFKTNPKLVHNFDILTHFLKKNKEIEESIRFIISLGRNYIIPDSVSAAMHWILTKIDPEKADTFIVKLAAGANLELNDPIHIIRKKVFDIKRIGAHVRKQELLNLIVQAWNAFYTNTPLINPVLKSGSDVIEIKGAK